MANIMTIGNVRGYIAKDGNAWQNAEDVAHGEGEGMDMEHYVFLVLMFLVATLINVTAAGWLALQMGLFMWKRLQEDPRFTSKSSEMRRT